MNADKVVIHHVERDRVGVIFDLLRKGVCQAREAAHVHPHREIVPLDIGRADVRRVGIAFDLFLLRASAFRRAVAALGAFGRRAVNLHKLRIVDIRAECAFNRLKISLVAVARKLNAIGETGAKIVDKHMAHSPSRPPTK